MKKLAFFLIAAMAAILMSTVVAFANVTFLEGPELPDAEVSWPAAGGAPPGAIHTFYTHQIRAVSSEGVDPWGWTVSSGALPPGFNLTARGVLQGTPSQAGTFNFSVTAQDSSGPSTQEFTLVVRIPSPLFAQYWYREDPASTVARNRSPITDALTFIGERYVFYRAWPGATIHYTLDGSTPTAASPVYNHDLGIHLTQTTRIRAIAIHPDYPTSPEMVMPVGQVRIEPNLPSGHTFTRIFADPGAIKLVSNSRPTIPWPDHPRNPNPAAGTWPTAKQQLSWIARGAGNEFENFRNVTTVNFNHFSNEDADGVMQNRFTYEFTNYNDASIRGRVQGIDGTITIFEYRGGDYVAVTSGATFDFAHQFTRYFSTMTEFHHDHPRPITPWGIGVERFPVVTQDYIRASNYHPREGFDPIFAERFPHRCIYFVYSGNTPMGFLTAMFKRPANCPTLPPTPTQGPAPTVRNIAELGGLPVPQGNRTFIGERRVFLDVPETTSEHDEAIIHYNLDGSPFDATPANANTIERYHREPGRETGILLTETTTIRAIAYHGGFRYSTSPIAEFTFTQINPGDGEIKLVSDLRPTLTDTLWTEDWPSAKSQLGWLARAAGNTNENFANDGVSSDNFIHVSNTGQFTYEFQNQSGSIQGRVQGDNGTITIFERNGDVFTAVTSGETFNFANQFARHFSAITEHGHDHPRTVTPWGIAVERFPVWTRQRVYAHGRPDGAPVFVARYPERSIYFVYSQNTPIGYMTAMFTRFECLGIEPDPPAATPTVLNFFKYPLEPPNGAPQGNRSFVGERTVFLGTETAGAEIRFTTDGTTPTAASALYNPTEGIVITQTTRIKAIATHVDYSDSAVLEVIFTRIAPGAGETKLVSGLRPTLADAPWADTWPGAKVQLAWLAAAAGNTLENFANNGISSTNFIHASVTGQFTYEFENLDGSIQGRVQGDNGTITIFERDGGSFAAVTSGATFDFANQFTRHFALITEYQHDHTRTVTPWGIAVERFPVVGRQAIVAAGHQNPPRFVERFPERSIYFVYSQNTPIGYMTAMFTRHDCIAFGPVPPTGVPNLRASTAALSVLSVLAAFFWVYVLRLKFVTTKRTEKERKS